MSKPMNHETAKKNLVALVAGNLPERTESSLRTHLQSCSECSRQLEVWQRLTRSLRRIPETTPTPARLARIAALARARREEVILQRQNRLVLTGLVLFGWTLSLLTLRGVWEANQWLAAWTGWPVMANPVMPVLLWLTMTWMAALALLPLLREHKTSLQENIR